MSVITLLAVLILGLETCQRSDRRHLGIHEDRQISTAAAQMLTIGEIVRAPISGDEPLICAHGEEPPTSERPCRTFHLRILDPGLLRIRLTWDSDLPLRLELRTLNDEQVKTACCRSPMELAEPIEVGLYEIEIIMLITSLARR